MGGIKINERTRVPSPRRRRTGRGLNERMVTNERMSKRDRYIIDDLTKQRRKRLRIGPTKAEYVLWQDLRRQKTGYKFRRQTSIDKFIVDFYCHELRLAIEVDGSIHLDDFQAEYDRRREEFLRRRGYVVIRFKNDEVLFERERVMGVIDEWCSRLAVKY